MTTKQMQEAVITGNALGRSARIARNQITDVSGDGREIEIANRSNILNISVFSNGDGILITKDLATTKKHAKRAAFYRMANSGGLDK